MANTADQNKGLFARRQRGTNDDIEIIVMILKEHPAIRLKVMNKVKQAKERIVRQQRGSLAG